MRRSRLDPEVVLFRARAALRYVISHAKTGGREGGYFAIFSQQADGALGEAVVFAAIGTIAPEKEARYRRLAEEKPVHLSQHPEHVSSWQSRNPNKDLWGGAVRTSEWYISFSGLPELCDEALVLIAARTLGFIDEHAAMQIALLSENQLYLGWTKSDQ